MLNNGGLGYSGSDLARALAPARELYNSMSWARELQEQLVPPGLRIMQQEARALRAAIGTTELGSSARQLVRDFSEMRKAVASPLEKVLSGSLADGVALASLHDAMKPVLALQDMFKPTASVTLAVEMGMSRFAKESGLGAVAAHLSEIREGLSPIANAIQRLGEPSYYGQMTAMPVYEPILRRELAPFVGVRPAPRAPAPPPISVTLDVVCLLCGEPVACTDVKSSGVVDYKLQGKLQVAPCATCLRRIVENPNYLKERLAEVERSRFTLLEGGGQGDGIRRGGVRIVRPPNDSDT